MSVSLGDIVELKSLASPPVLVKEVLSATHILLYGDVASWNKCKAMVANTHEFLKLMKEFETSKVTPSMKEKLKPICEKSEFTYEHISKVSKAAANLCKWVLDNYNSS